MEVEDPGGTQAPLVVVDAHVHVYDCFDLGRFFDSAWRNLRAEARRQGAEERFAAVLLLTESAGHDWFRALGDGRTIRGWRAHPTQESESLRLEGAHGETLFLIAGRQIVTREDLEVLALATDRSFPDGGALGETVRAVREADAVAVIPWGTGKWWGKRGALLREHLESDAGPALLGDNSARPLFWREPSHFEIARKRGGRVLPGSDPLPFPSEAWRPGSFGFTLRAPLDPATPARDVRAALTNAGLEVRPFGARENPWRFFRNQVAMQLRKRRRAA